MAKTLDNPHQSRALLYTGIAALILTLLILFMKWRIEMPIITETRSEIEVELNLPPDPPSEEEGGGGGGNPAQAIGAAGAAPEASLTAGETEPAKAIEEAEEKETAVAKPITVKKEAPKLAKTAPVKTTPKKEETPAPPAPKMVMGKKNKGTGTGAETPDDFNSTGNRGTGWGTGSGSGSGGGSGSGAGGGNGSGVGTGNGPRVTQGNRKVVKAYAFDGEMERATIFAQIRVSPEGKGTFVDFAKGSTHRTNTYKQAIVQYLNRIQFDKSDQEDLVVVQFNFLVN